jgi:hypothetical protein
MKPIKTRRRWLIAVACIVGVVWTLTGPAVALVPGPGSVDFRSVSFPRHITETPSGEVGPANAQSGGRVTLKPAIGVLHQPAAITVEGVDSKVLESRLSGATNANGAALPTVRLTPADGS